MCTFRKTRTKSVAPILRRDCCSLDDRAVLACGDGHHYPRPQTLPDDVSDEARAIVAPFLALVRAESPRRRHDLREVFNASRWIACTGAP